MSTYHVSIVPSYPTPSSALRSKYRDIRLQSLKTDPIQFSSNYEREIAFTEEVWRSRFEAKEPWPQIEKAIIVAWKGSADDGLENGEWLGLVAFLAPTHEAVLPNLEKWAASKTRNIYVVVGTWIHPEHRGKGIGKKLMLEGLNWVKRREKALVKEDEDEDTMVVLDVRTANLEAVGLYTAVGFKSQNTGCVPSACSKCDSYILWFL